MNALSIAVAVANAEAPIIDTTAEEVIEVSAQTVFNECYRNLFSQGAQSANDGGGCMYRGPNDCKCAVGFFIPDANYYPRLEGSTIEASKVLNALPLEYHAHKGLLGDLQANVHDIKGAWSEPRDLHNAFAAVAARHGLKMPREYPPVAYGPQFLHY
jgi:hypothetical protein